MGSSLLGIVFGKSFEIVGELTPSLEKESRSTTYKMVASAQAAVDRCGQS
ncbi:hypothetical protein Hanom_Chr02g00154551 [Helianthus anomalus]